VSSEEYKGWKTHIFGWPI